MISLKAVVLLLATCMYGCAGETPQDGQPTGETTSDMWTKQCAGSPYPEVLAYYAQPQTDVLLHLRAFVHMSTTPVQTHEVTFYTYPNPETGEGTYVKVECAGQDYAVEFVWTN